VAAADEADVTVEALRILRPLLPGAHFHVHDGAMVARHNQTLLTELGTVLVNRTRATKKASGAAMSGREPDHGLIERKRVNVPGGGQETLAVYQVDGHLGLAETDEEGATGFTPLEPTKLIVQRNKRPGPHPFRPYVALKLPPEVAPRLGRREITVALYQTAQDRARRYLRTAHVRAIPPGSPDFRIYRRMRGDSESLNRAIEDSLYRHHRAHSAGAAAQEVDMFGFAGLVNALTRERMRRARLARAAQVA